MQSPTPPFLVPSHGLDSVTAFGQCVSQLRRMRREVLLECQSDLGGSRPSSIDGQATALSDHREGLFPRRSGPLHLAVPFSVLGDCLGFAVILGLGMVWFAFGWCLPFGVCRQSGPHQTCMRASPSMMCAFLSLLSSEGAHRQRLCPNNAGGCLGLDHCFGEGGGIQTRGSRTAPPPLPLLKRTRHEATTAPTVHRTGPCVKTMGTGGWPGPVLVCDPPPPVTMGRSKPPGDDQCTRPHDPRPHTTKCVGSGLTTPAAAPAQRSYPNSIKALPGPVHRMRCHAGPGRGPRPDWHRPEWVARAAGVNTGTCSAPGGKAVC